jgi:hypothetical protein
MWIIFKNYTIGSNNDFFFVSGEPLQHDPEFKGPLQKRSCTDIICLLLFIAFIVAWAAVGIYGKEQICCSVCQCVVQLHKQGSSALLDMVLK